MISKYRFSELLKTFRFAELFNELGWDHVEKKISLSLDEENFSLDAIAEKRGFAIFTCSPNKLGRIPESKTRRKIDSRITKLYFEHLIIYSDDKTHQIWQLVIREPNKPITNREVQYFTHQTPELLYQKLSALFVSLEEEDKIRLVDIRSNVYEQFNINAERVTRRFYTEFKTNYSKFISFIKGISEKVDLEWYASLMLDRLMFIYFIQKKGFLDKDRNYLRNKLNLVQSKKGKDKFYSFYKDFLLVLFHKGLGSPERTRKLESELGKIPYLNGGLFEVHKLEREYDITIADKAFENIFDFFDQYNWVLDTKITATGRDINPDVIGYIFEKYVNDRAAMGAYYTKEDITEYISKNTIIPFLFNEVKKECANAFREDSSLWKMLRENPDRYIYDAVKHGVYCYSDPDLSGEESQKRIRPLPPEIQLGINPEIQNRIVKDVVKNPPQLLELRKEWNKSAPAEYALPTEIWREVVERRNRYFDIKNKIENGEIKEINDFITYNLDIRQFAQDAVEQYEGSDFINAFFKAISKISILDPTCGSGAFLFAALNILEPSFEACLKRMREFVEEDNLKEGRKFSQFRSVLKEIEHHPNEKYFIYKSIILNNLYGVDIMNEAVETAKLRLFLKLVAEIEVDYDKPNLGLEPLPDIDFNIRCGNTLIGFVRLEDVRKALEGELNFDTDLIAKIDEEAELVNKAFKYFKSAQINIENSVLLSGKKGDGDEEAYKNFILAKKDLEKRLKKLTNELNVYLAKLYGKTPQKKNEYEHWLTTHQPFHWFAEFYGIINSGGFDVIIGNPPYIEYSGIDYVIKNFKTLDCGNLYAFVMERILSLKHHESKLSLIVPLSGHSTDRMKYLIKYFYHEAQSLYISNFSGDANPSRLFDGVKFRLSIFLASFTGDKKIYTTKYIRWYSEERNNLFSKLSYSLTNSLLHSSILKNPSPLTNKILEKINNKKYTFTNYQGSFHIYYHNAPVNWIRAHSFIPFFKSNRDGNKISTQLKPIGFRDQNSATSVSGVICSSTFFLWWLLTSDCYHLNARELFNFKLELDQIIIKLKNQSSILMKDLLKNSKRRVYNYKTSGEVEYDEFYLKQSKEIIDEIDKVLAEHYGFTEEELDFIINYDIKYRMGKELEEE